MYNFLWQSRWEEKKSDRSDIFAPIFIQLYQNQTKENSDYLMKNSFKTLNCSVSSGCLIYSIAFFFFLRNKRFEAFWWKCVSSLFCLCSVCHIIWETSLFTIVTFPSSEQPSWKTFEAYKVVVASFSWSPFTGSLGDCCGTLTDHKLPPQPSRMVCFVAGLWKNK